MPEISADDIHGFLTGGLDDGRLYDEDDELVALLYTDVNDDTIHAVVPDSQPQQLLGRFRVHVEKLAD